MVASDIHVGCRFGTIQPGENGAKLTAMDAGTVEICHFLTPAVAKICPVGRCAGEITFRLFQNSAQIYCQSHGFDGCVLFCKSVTE